MADQASIWLHPYFAAIVIPAAIILLGALAKKLVRGTPFERYDFFLGVEGVLAAMSAALIYVFEVLRVFSGQDNASLENLKPVGFSVGFTVICLLILFALMGLHQDWTREERESQFAAQVWRLGVCGNILGFGLVSGFIVFVKGV